MRSIKILEIKSEIGAGARGASLGTDALKTAGWDLKNNFFQEHQAEEIAHENDCLYQPAATPYARYIQSMLKIYGRLSKKVAETLKDKQYPIVLSGDHATAGATIAGIKMACPEARTGIIWIDAHADLHTPYTTPSGNIHGMPLTATINEDNIPCKKNAPDAQTIAYWDRLKQTGNCAPKVSPKDIVIIGLRDYEKEEDALIKKHGITTISIEDVREKGTSQIALQTLKQLGDCDLIYLSFDVDSLDPSLSRGTGTPVENGLWKEEAEDLVARLLRDPRIGCFEITEINPALDTENKMAKMAFDILVKGAESIKSREPEIHL